VIEPSVGVDRCFLAVLCSAYTEDLVGGEPRTLLRFHPRLAPIKAAVFPLVKNNEAIMALSQDLHKRLQRRHNVAFDAAGNIGRRYRRMDEAGTPFCVTVDYQSLEDGTVTLRDRDSTQQRRITVDDLVTLIADAVE
jgi:glycyl-tRNA synthetase